MSNARDRKPDLEKVLRMIAAAVAAGTHSDRFVTVCSGCRQWVDGIYLTVPGTHQHLCRKCCGLFPEK